jgi:hypothetical protein
VSDFARWSLAVLIVAGAGSLTLPIAGVMAQNRGLDLLDEAIGGAWVGSVVVAVAALGAFLVGVVRGLL